MGDAIVLRTHPAGALEGRVRAPGPAAAGVYEPWHFLAAIGDGLNAAGHPVHVVPEIRYNRDSITAVAASAQRYLDSHDLHDVALVGHSKGGLIGKHMMAIDDVDHRITCLAAVVTPFGGSTMARFMMIRTLRAFMPTDATISTLAANLELNARITSVYGEFDPQIPGGSRLDGAVTVAPDCRPLRLLADERVIRAVVAAVQGTPQK